MSSIYAQPTEILRLERDPYAEGNQPERPFRIVLFNPELGVMEVDASHAVLNLNRAHLIELHRISGELLADSAEEAGGRG